MMIKATLHLTVWLIKGNSFKRYEKIVDLPIPPTPKLMIDGYIVDYVSVNAMSGIVKCVMAGVDTNDDNDTFESVCANLTYAGWTRI